MSFEEAVLWAFNTDYSGLNGIYWSHTLSQLRSVVSVRLGWCHTQALQQYQVMAILLSQAFGPPDDKVQEPTNLADAKAKLAAVFR